MTQTTALIAGASGAAASRLVELLAGRISDPGKLRRTGFGGAVDTEAMFFSMLGRYRAARLLP